MYRNTLPLAFETMVAACADAPPDRDLGFERRPPSAAAPSADTSTANDEIASGVIALVPSAASRLLDQATFGARPFTGTGAPPLDTVEHVMTRTAGGAVVDLLGVPTGAFAATPPHPGPNCDLPFDPAFDLGNQFFNAALTAPDQLRLRVMFSLHQILVVSENAIGETRTTCNSERRDAMTRYLNALRAGAFGNFRTLLEVITLEPAMGTFLDMTNNVAFDTSGARITPNENFARELLQLFTVGTELLNDDGTVKVDAEGNPRPTYNEAHVQNFARTLTGWTYADPAGCPTVGATRRASYGAPMIPCQVNHDNRAARLLNYAGAVNAGLTTAGATAQVHLDEALDNLFHHPNLPPFVSKQLIGHLVTSNPSPAYVARVVAVFKDDGTTAHNRGNLRAVVRAILLDPEARAAPGPTAGRLRSPAELIARITRSLGATVDLTKTPGRSLNTYSGMMGQAVPRPPSVFSYYAPGTPVPGDNPNDLVGPAFGVLDTGTITVRANFVHDLLHGAGLNTAGVGYDVATALPADDAGIVDWIDSKWLHGAMSTELRTTLTTALADGRVGTLPLRHQQLALYLAALSPEFQIQR